MAISRNERALLVIRDIVTGSRPELRPLYEFAETASATIDNALGLRYGTIVKLSGAQATEDNFIERISDLGADNSIQAIDVIVILHGNSNHLYFHAGATAMGRIKYRLSCLKVRRKLRMLYSTACYGLSHADDFVAAGFDAAVGSRAVNTNGATEFPLVLAAWAAGSSLQQAIAAGAVGYQVSDQIAEDNLGFNDANSCKEFAGNEDVNINSEPTFDGKVYFFKGNRYIRWNLKTGEKDSGYPKLISEHWCPFMADGIDAAVNWSKGHSGVTYFFKGNQYIRWNLETNEMDDDYPKAISAAWESQSFMDGGIDAAVNWINNKVYLFKGNQYIRWDVERTEVDSGYPKLISANWAPFMANGIDAAINWGNGKAYFFKGDEYIRWTIGVGMDDGYPKPIEPNWHSFIGNGVDAALLWLR